MLREFIFLSCVFQNVLFALLLENIFLQLMDTFLLLNIHLSLLRTKCRHK